LDAIGKLIESPNLHAGGLQMKKMKVADVYEIRASLELRIIASRKGEDILCVRVGRHDETLKGGPRPVVSARCPTPNIYERSLQRRMLHSLTKLRRKPNSCAHS